MALKADETAPTLIDDVCARVRELVNSDEAPLVEEFVAQYYARVPADDLAGRSEADVYGAALAQWNFVHRRPPGEPKVRIYNPQFERHGWQSTHTVVEIVVDDMPFLIDSLTMEINRHRHAIHLLVRPVIRVERDDSGEVTAVLSADAADKRGAAESVVHVEIDRQAEGSASGLRDDLLRVLGDVRAAVEDWPRMRERARDLIAELDEAPPPLDTAEIEEAKALLAWLEDGQFTFLGYREYDLISEDGEDQLRTVEGSGLGILRDSGGGSESRSFQKLAPHVRALARAPRLLNLTKANSRATVHRPSYLDYVSVKRMDSSGEVLGERRFLGLYTTTAYRAIIREIPVVRRKVGAVLKRAALPSGGHDEKALMEILDTYPRDEIFQIPEDQLYEIATGILELAERQRVRLFVRPDEYERFLSCLVFLPRDRFNTENRVRIAEILQEAFDADQVDFEIRLSESVLARIHYICRTPPGPVPGYDVGEIEAQIVAATRWWVDDLHDALVEQSGEELGEELFTRYGQAFPAAYRSDWVARSAVADITRIEELPAHDGLGMSLYQPLEAPPEVLRCKLFRSGAPVSLSEVLPMFENMRLRVADERPYEIHPRDGEATWICDFGLRYRGDEELETDDVREGFQEAFARIWRDEAENDGFNGLVLAARLPWREVMVLRAIGRYLRQAATTFSDRYTEQTLLAHPDIARGLIELFRSRFDPARERDDAAAEAMAHSLEEAIDAVESLDEDRILRNFLAVVQGMLRTNYFQVGADGQPKPYLSFKLDPKRIPVPPPRPRFEIYVYSPRTEGVHLRGGKVARGGLRWSDRREDFRTEVLGLVKAQMVKNAVIVPVGAKGGFVVKHPPPGREALEAEVEACYRTFIGALLDLTDNIVEGEIVPPERVVRHDDDDTYLVVAADKGTATFSDLANGVAGERGFWLGDAFASGGSVGYDHKKMGITARGAWESVKRHFRDLGVDTQTADFTVVGIGDMSGDVFGNGMLLSEHIKLVGAFDHRHVFIDPDPDPATTFAERKRLFELPRSSWVDYDESLISEGGGIWPRTAKSIALSAEAREVLDVEAERMTPNEVIAAMLRAPVDLLWNGGIGTYVKASTETHSHAGDKANDAVRVNGNELHCKVVGEGGNLGLTQRARIEFALAGGRINTDAIDNSAGVDCSDHEVNIKILLDSIVAAGDMTEKQRNEVLGAATDAVAELVLRDNYTQTRALSLARAQAPSMLDVHDRLITSLEQAGKLDRTLEALPDAEAIAERNTARLGLTQPELSVLLAYSKITLYAALLDSDLPEDPFMSRALGLYFPSTLPSAVEEPMRRHHLRREIIATLVTNQLVDRGGITLCFRLQEDTGAPAFDVARAFAIASEVFEMWGMWNEVDALDNRVETDVQIELLLEARKMIERATRWLLQNRRRPLDVGSEVERFAAGARTLSAALPDILVESDRQRWDAAVESRVEAEVPEPLAEWMANLGAMFSALDLVEVADETSRPVEEVAPLHFLIGGRFHLHWLRDRIAELARTNRWEAMARAAVRDDLFSLHAELTADVLRETDAEGDAESLLEAWMAANRAAVERYLWIIGDINTAGIYDLTTLPVALREVRNLIHSTGAAAHVR